MSDLIRVLIVDDHALVREGLRAVIETQSDMTLVGEAADGIDAVIRAHILKPDVVLMDLVMPRKNGIEATEEIKRVDPSIRVLVLSTFVDDDKIFGVIKAGATGYILKDSTPHDLLQAIRNVYQGKAALDPTIARKLIDQYLQSGKNPSESEVNLTERERMVLRLLARGETNQQIAEKLSVAEGTVRFHVSNILGKLHLENRTQAVLYALQNGLASLEGD